MTNILFVEDDANLGLLLKENLENKGFNVSWHKNGEDGIGAIMKNKFNLCILDVMLPVKDGFTLSKEIRKVDGSIPIIFLTARGQHEDKMKGFETGADDYITKPFNTQELCMRIQAVLRRTETQLKKQDEPCVITIGALCFDYNKMLLTVHNEPKKLSLKEADVLKILLQNRNVIVPRKQILERVWGNDDYFASKSMDVYLSKIRKLIKEEKSIEILNAYGLGFKMIVKE
jgi:DNA-binding response OmpR family regulator